MVRMPDAVALVVTGGTSEAPFMVSGMRRGTTWPRISPPPLLAVWIFAYIKPLAISAISSVASETVPDSVPDVPEAPFKGMRTPAVLVGLAVPCRCAAKAGEDKPEKLIL